MSTDAQVQAVPRVVVVGAGFAGIGCAKELAKHDDVHVTLLDRHNYQAFMPLLYQVATAQLAPSDVALDIRAEFRKHANVDVKLTTVVDVDPSSRTVITETGEHISGDYLVMAAGGRANYFRTPGSEHAWPLYSLEDAERLRSRILAVFEDADRDPSLLDKGALTFVIVGAGATGTEIAGALAELVRDVMPSEYHDLAVERAKIIMVDLGQTVLPQFSDSAHDYATKVLHRDGVEIRLGVSITEIGPDHVSLSDDSTILTHCVIWAGGMQAAEVASADALPTGRGGRISVEPDLCVSEFPGVYAVGDIANIGAPDGSVLPQLGSVALQAGQWAAKNIRADVSGKARTAFHYHDKGIMAMIGRGAAVAEVGAHRHELHGPIAFSAWLGVHVVLLSGVRSRVDAFVSWAWDYFTKNRGPQVLDRSDAARIDWGATDDTDSGGTHA